LKRLQDALLDPLNGKSSTQVSPDLVKRIEALAESLLFVFLGGNILKSFVLKGIESFGNTMEKHGGPFQV